VLQPTSSRQITAMWGNYLLIAEIIEANDIKASWGGGLSYNETDEFFAAIRQLSIFDSDLLLDNTGKVVPMSEGLGLANWITGANGEQPE
jgi:hypothetical protein